MDIADVIAALNGRRPTPVDDPIKGMQLPTEYSPFTADPYAVPDAAPTPEQHKAFGGMLERAAPYVKSGLEKASGHFLQPALEAIKGSWESTKKTAEGPKAAMEGVQLENPNTMTEADAYRLNKADEAATYRPIEFAKNMVLGGALGGLLGGLAPSGAVGVAGGKLLDTEGGAMGAPNAKAVAEALQAPKEVTAKAPEVLKAFKDITGREHGTAPTDLPFLGRGDVSFPPGKSLDTLKADVAEKIADVKEWNNPQRRYWYENSGNSIFNSVGRDPEMADRLTAAIAKTSQGTPVLDNAAYSARGHAQAMVGDPVTTGRFPNAMGEHITKYYNEPKVGVIGPKITGYQSGFRSVWDPASVNQGANDIHNMRWLGFKKGASSNASGPTTVNGETYTGTPTTTQHNYDRLVRSAVTDQLNREGFDNGGWVPGQVQAVGWAKTRAGGGVPEEEAGYDIPMAFNDRAARMHYETAPGKTGNHMPEYHSAPYETRQAYHDAINNVLTDENGRDVIASHMGLLTLPSEHGVGVFEGGVNPGSAARIVSGAQGGWQAGMDPATRELMQSAELARGLLLRQDAVAAHMPVYPKGLTASKANTVDVRTGVPMTPEEAQMVAQHVNKETGSDFFSPIFTDRGHRYVNVPEASGLSNKEFHAAIDRALEKAYPDKSVESVKGYSDLFYHPNDWSKGNAGYLEALRQQRPDVQRRVAEVLATLGPKVSRIEDEFAARHGWTPDPTSRIWEVNKGLKGPQFEKVAPGTPPKPWKPSGIDPELYVKALHGSAP